MQVPEVAEVLFGANAAVGGVQEYDVPTPVAIVPVAPWKLYVKVCVNELDALGVEMVNALPIVPLDADGVVALGMVGTDIVTDVLADAVPS